MLKKVKIILLFVAAIRAANLANNLQSKSDPNTLQSEILTIENLEELLKRAGEIFKNKVQRSDASTAENQPEMSVPIQFLKPPGIQPYNFIFPLFDYDHTTAQTTKLDDKSRKVERFTPRSQPKKGAGKKKYETKPKKSLEKKFNGGSKHNIKWQNSYEKQLPATRNKESIDVPRELYLLNDERNRINFDDSFFANDMKVPDRKNKLEKFAVERETQNEDEDDLIAAAGLQIPLITQFTSFT